MYVTIDKDFNTLPYGRYGAATVYLPDTNQALLIGGILNGALLRAGLVDDPGHRKIHRESVPLAGGLTVMTALLAPFGAHAAAARSAFDPGNTTTAAFI